MPHKVNVPLDSATRALCLEARADFDATSNSSSIVRLVSGECPQSIPLVERQKSCFHALFDASCRRQATASAADMQCLSRDSLSGSRKRTAGRKLPLHRDVSPYHLASQVSSPHGLRGLACRFPATWLQMKLQRMKQCGVSLAQTKSHVIGHGFRCSVWKLR